MQKVTDHLYPKNKFSGILPEWLVMSLFKTSSVIFVMICFEVTDYFFSEQYFSINYTEYHHKFQTQTCEKVIANSYVIINLRSSVHEGNITIFASNNMDLALQLSHNEFNKITLSQKGIKLFWRKASESSEKITDNKVFGIADMT